MHAMADHVDEVKQEVSWCLPLWRWIPTWSSAHSHTHTHTHTLYNVTSGIECQWL